jgi:hypothetical protein
MTKVCSKCGKEKGLDEFYKKISGVFGVSARCKTCSSIIAKERYMNNKDDICAAAREYRKHHIDNRDRIFIDESGYVCIVLKGKHYREHRYIWERSNGPIPDGYVIHHIDGNKTNNNIENLQLLSKINHTRIHNGWVLIDNTWYKPCSACHQILPETSFPMGKSRCKICYVTYKKELRERKLLNNP